MSSIGSRPLKSCAAVCPPSDRVFGLCASFAELGDRSKHIVSRHAGFSRQPSREVSRILLHPDSASDFGELVHPDHHLLAPQIAAGDTAPSFPQVRASVSPSRRPDSRAGPTSTFRMSGAFSPVGVDLASFFPGSWPSESEPAGGRITRFCTAASRSPGSGPSLRLTIP